MVAINTNIASLMVQRGLSKSTDALTSIIERMSTGYKVNNASDNAANYAITQNISAKISSLNIAESNASLGLDMVMTMSSSLDLISRQAVRLRNLAEEALNGTYGDKSIEALNTEAQAIIDEIIRITNDNDYDEISLFSNSTEDLDAENMITLQVGTNGDVYSQIQFNAYFSISDILGILDNGIDNSQNLDIIDNFLNRLNNKQVEFGAVENRLTSVLDSISVKYDNLVSTRSTLRDADAGKLSSQYIQQQILQQTAAALLSVTNQNPAIALNLI